MWTVILSDVSFANGLGLKTQLGSVISMADKERCANIVYYALSGLPCISRSVAAAAVNVLLNAVAMRMVVMKTLSKLLHRNDEINAYFSSRTLFDALTNNSHSAERRLQTDVFALKQSYKKKELRRSGYFPVRENAADVLLSELLF